ncbi:helix-turn-helix domain-containing protein [Zhouia sp. PK063]|uniref:helix-turn-helix domain-containing protein n=1 Tax=Zhouia sp. PK063 TaxID=3373602 RepID=UPI0037AD126E
MNYVSDRVKVLRKQKGLSQDALAQLCGLSLRTIQRIENGETVPRGDTLQRLAFQLNTTSEDITGWHIPRDNNFIMAMLLSALSFLFFPLLGIFVPFIFWMLKKDNIQNINYWAKKIIGFEVLWNMLLLAAFFGMRYRANTMLFQENGLDAGVLEHHYNLTKIILIALYITNAIFIGIMVVRLKKKN